MLSPKSRKKPTAKQAAAAWTDRRRDAALGKSGDLARRAAQNDDLWLWFIGMEAARVHVTMEMLRDRVGLDIVRSRLYPTPDFLLARNRKTISKSVKPEIVKGKPTGKFLPVPDQGIQGKLLKVDYTDPHPPAWFISEMPPEDVEKTATALGAFLRPGR